MSREPVHAALHYHVLDTRRSRTATPVTRTEDRRETRRDRVILCLACRARITDASERIEVDGRHEHTFFNPAGIVFRIVCFANAPGCTGEGPATAEFSWFAGHRWQAALCASCMEHLGWHFDGPNSFTALIADRIAESE